MSSKQLNTLKKKETRSVTAKKSDRDLLEEMSEKMDQMREVNEDMKRRLDDMDEQLKRIASLENEIKTKDKKIDLLECKVEELEQRSRMSNIVIRGVKEVRGEICSQVVECIGKRIGIQNPEYDIQICHRVQSRNKKAPRPIVVRLSNTKTRDTWVRLAKQAETWKENTYVHEHLTPIRQQLLHDAKELAKKLSYKYVWTRDCKILMKKADIGTTHVIKSSLDLERIERSNNIVIDDSIIQDETFST